MVNASFNMKGLTAHSTYARVDTSAIKHNLTQLRRVLRKAGRVPRVWATIKVDAYGHGIRHVIPVLQEADGMVVLDLSEARLCRHAGWRGPILILNGLNSVGDAMLLDDPDLHWVITTQHQLTWLRQCQPAHPPTVWLRYSGDFNHTGFNRATYAKAYQEACALKRCGLIKEVGHVNHYARAEQIGGITAPLADFLHVIQNLPGPVCTSNSGALLLLGKNNMHDDWVRPGLMLYGASPLPALRGSDLHLRPAMSLHSQIAAVRKLPAGAKIDGSHSFIASQDMKIGIVACGYADGYPRQATRGTPVLVEGIRTQLLGPASMDTLMVDLTAIPAARPGSAVTLWGTTALPIEEVAAHAGTIAATLMTGLTPRLSIRAEHSLI